MPSSIISMEMEMPDSKLNFVVDKFTLSFAEIVRIESIAPH